MKLKCLAVLAGSLLISGAAIAEYPERPIKLIIGYSPGGAADAVARIYSAALADKLGQPVVIENRPGAGSTISSAAIAKADPDGYTLGMASGTLYGIDKYVYNVSYSPDDFTPIMRLSMSPLILAVGAESDINTFPEFFEKAKANPGTMFYSSSGIGGSPQTSSLVLENAIGTEFTHVPYKGGARPCWQLRRGMWTSRLVRQHLCCRSAWAGK
ncbi:Bug family tripartite tricarboxylate transporter substrate binding protein [Orrella marina]